MAFVKKILLNADSIKDMKIPGSTIEGYYIGKKVIPSGSLHVFNTAKGNEGVFGARMLDDLLLTVPAGEMTRVTYLEKKALGNGKSMKIYDVESDNTNTIDVSSVSKGTNVSYQEVGADLGAEDAVGAEEELDEAATAEPLRRGHAQATAAAANTAKAFFRKK